MSAAELRSAFAAQPERHVQIDLSEVARCRADPDLAAPMLEAFLRSKLSLGLEHDPDVFERLLRGLLELDPEVVRAALPSADLSELGEASWRDLEHNWLRPMAGDGVSFEAPPPAHGDAAGRLVASVLDEQLAAGRDALRKSSTAPWQMLTALMTAPNTDVPRPRPIENRRDDPDFAALQLVAA